MREGLEPELEFIERNIDRPFFLWFAPVLPHLPHDAPAKYRQLYADSRPSERGYFANISWFDDGIGRLVDRVRELGLERRTLFVYVVDNGWDTRAAESAEVALLGGPHGKMSLHELGLRTPVLLRWLGGIEPAPHRDELVSLTDVFTTLLDYAGVPAPDGRIGHSLRSYSGQFKGARVHMAPPRGAFVLSAHENSRGKDPKPGPSSHGVATLQDRRAPGGGHVNGPKFEMAPERAKRATRCEASEAGSNHVAGGGPIKVPHVPDSSLPLLPSGPGGVHDEDRHVGHKDRVPH